MLKTARRSNRAEAQQTVTEQVTHLLVKGMAGLLVAAMVLQAPAFAADAADRSDFKKNENSLYRNVFDHNVYFDNTSILRFDRLGRKLTGRKLRAANANVYDEVADSTFFTNRQGRKSLSEDQLIQGGGVTSGPDLSGKLRIIGGELMGLRPVFTVLDSKDDEYTLYFDSPDSLGLMTGAMAAASRFYHAIGYNVPQVTLVSLSTENLTPDPKSRFADSSGFKKVLTQEKLDELVLMIPWAEDGKFRAAAVKTPTGRYLGPLKLQGRRKNDPNDKWPQEQRRELRALRIFGSWLNDFNVQNIQDYVVKEDGKVIIKHYISGFHGAFGSDTKGSKPPMVGYEYLYDAGETSKAFWTLGFWEKPWQRRLRETGEEVPATAVGYFDNKGFRPEKFKTFLPQYVFKDVTRADAFWAAKIIKSFSDADIRTLVKTGEYADNQDEKYIADTLIERRDIVARYWFSQAAPLDDFELSGGRLTFTDLEAEYDFDESSEYQVDVTAGKRKIASSLVKEPAVKIEDSWMQNGPVEIWIRKNRGGKLSPYVLVKTSNKGIAEVIHQD
jgi:hypothetical protein